MAKRLFVGNLSWSTTEAALLAAFEAFGATSATIPTGHDGRAKGFGFVDVPDDQMGPAIEAMNGKEIDGRQVNVNEARPREERPSR